MKNKTPSTQHYLNVGDIRDDVIILRNGELRQVLAVQALNFALKSEQEQTAIVYQYQSFLNSLEFPIQIVIQSRQLDLTNYISGLEQQLNNTTSQLMKVQIGDYMEFVNRLINLGDIMEKHFYVVVPLTNPTIQSRNLLRQILKRETIRLTDKQFTEAKGKLTERVQSIQSGLGSIGLASVVLSGQKLANMLYSTFNPIEAGEAGPAVVKTTPTPATP